uniref:kinesin-like protein KIF20A n=1 Tax=Scatophagus argus TaxID=75038 RepID=UPI001ED84B9B|nr:kinesin-like protein KIF20A [Scatophagus argus]XP_046267035.1 kinesin-like protein KIF20A [Scatophagus argus]XP_046267036.1 kinesin-like protein KIF20A [Scatophagus argus]XP_046267037.1 kinesin-like protein KIF20A [Scatophagus argus]
MALSLSSPCGCPYDEDEEIAVFESTAAEHGGPARPRLPEISVISPGLDTRQSTTESKLEVKRAVVTQGSCNEGSTERVKVFLRIRPLTETEREKGEEQGCVAVQDEETLLLKAPKESQNMRTAERGITQSMHKFSFSKIFGPETAQQKFYECTMKTMVKDVLQGENRLLYTYGVTNSGKTYTIQGRGQEAGLLPRALASLFRKLQGRLYGAMDLKPIMYQDVRQLDAGEVRVEEIRRNSLLKEDENQSSCRGGTTTVWDSGIGGLSYTTHIATQLEDTDSVCLEPDSLSHSGGDDLEEGVQFSIWVSFYEIYNEFLYDLLDASPSLHPRKRVTLRLSEDKQGNPYVKDLTWIQVRSAEEAWRILRAGCCNQSFASTHFNQNSSRSHSIFSIRVLRIRPVADSSPAVHISELVVCDLAGSERCKEQRNGERMKEANNINTSLLTLGRCITALRHNQNSKTRPPQVVPFRDSKLTRVLQGFFCGRGTSSMVVNINPCASIYDETLQALKFSAIATQLVHGPSTKTRVAYILSLLRQPTANGNESTLMEEEEDESDVEDGNITMLNNEALLQAIDVLKREVQRQREEREVLEANVREQVVSEMMEVISEMQDGFRETLEAERALIEERYEDKIANIQKHLKKFYSQELKERDQEIEALSAALEKSKEAESVPQRDSGGPRRSQRLMTQTESGRLQAEFDQCRAELLTKTEELTKLKMQLEIPGSTGSLTSAADRKLEEGQRNLRQLRLDLQRLGADLQSGERACCRNTGGERLRQALAAADETLAKQDQILVELQNGLMLVKADLRRKAETLAQTQAVQPQLPPSGCYTSATLGFCKKRGCGAAAPNDTENRPPQKRSFFPSLTCTPTRKYNSRAVEQANVTPYSRVLRSRQKSPPFGSPFTPRFKY